MAHDWYMKHGKDNYMEQSIKLAFDYADAMQVEADKREKEKQDKAKQEQKNYEDALDSIGIAELMKDHVHDYIYGRICACGAVNGAEEEWQPAQ